LLSLDNVITFGQAQSILYCSVEHFYNGHIYNEFMPKTNKIRLTTRSWLILNCKNLHGYNDVTDITNKFDDPLEFIITEFESNLYTTTTLGTLVTVALLTGGRCSDVATCYKNSKWDLKNVVVVDKWSLFGDGCLLVFDGIRKIFIWKFFFNKLVSVGGGSEGAKIRV